MKDCRALYGGRTLSFTKLMQPHQVWLYTKQYVIKLGRFYQAKGFKYAPSSKKLQYQYQEFKFKIQFASSHSNMAGEWVLVEINAGMYPVRLEKQYKAAKEKISPIILFNIGLLDELIVDKPVGTIVGVNPFGEEKETFVTDYPYALRKYSRSLNSYNKTLTKFRKTLEYINKLIEYSFSLMLNESEMIKHLKRANDRDYKFYKEKRFVDYLHLYYPEDSPIFQYLLSSNEG